MRGLNLGWNQCHAVRFVTLTWLLVTGLMGASGQLVNPGFELSSGMPSAPGMWHLLHGWNNALSGISSPDFFHLDGTLGGDLPETPVALVQPVAGRGLAGLAVIKRNGAGQPLSREYLVQMFDAPLEVGQHYELSFGLTNGVRLPTSQSGLSVNGVGIALSENQPAQFGDGVLDLSPVFQFPYARYDEEWEQVTMTFQADVPHRFLTIGVFLPDDALEVEIRAGINPSLAYYFFDDFSLTPVPPPGEPGPAGVEVKDPVDDEKPEASDFSIFVPNAFSPNGDGLNDVFKPQVGEIMPVSFGIYTRWGQRIAELDPGSPEWDGKDSQGALLSPGVYIWMLEWPRSVPRDQRTQQGAVMLLH